jgi:hypothetical protein
MIKKNNTNRVCFPDKVRNVSFDNQESYAVECLTPDFRSGRYFENKTNLEESTFHYSRSQTTVRLTRCVLPPNLSLCIKIAHGEVSFHVPAIK